MTPENSNSGTEHIGHIDFDRNIIKRFTTTEAITTIQRFLLAGVSLPSEIPHVHQIGVLGLAHNCNHLRNQDPAQVLNQAQNLAQRLIEIVKEAPERFLQPNLLSPATKIPRIPKIWISVNEAASNLFSDSARNRIVYRLKHSDFCHQLLGFCTIDRLLWKQSWQPMTEEERDKAENVGNILFGDPSKHYLRTTFLNIYVLLASEKGEKNTVFLRLSLGLGFPVPLDCGHCERDVMLFDSIRATGAVQLNVPLRQAGPAFYEYSEMVERISVEVAKWAERVGHLKGWWPCVLPRPLPDYAPSDTLYGWSPYKAFDLGIWDPSATMEPPMTFQPYVQEEPGVLFLRPCPIHRRVVENFEPYPDDENLWDPDGLSRKEMYDDDSDSDNSMTGT